MIRLLICDDDMLITKKINGLAEAFAKENRLLLDTAVHTECDFDCWDKKEFDIAVVDVEMPGIGGLELAERLRRENDAVLVIILTSYPAYLDDAMKIHVFRYLSKPVDEDRFIKNFKEAVAEYSAKGRIITLLDSTGGAHVVRTEDILTVETTRRGCILNTKRGSFKSGLKPQQIKTQLGDFFVFSHASVLVNLQNVIDFDRTTVTLRKTKAKPFRPTCRRENIPTSKRNF